MCRLAWCGCRVYRRWGLPRESDYVPNPVRCTGSVRNAAAGHLCGSERIRGSQAADGFAGSVGRVGRDSLSVHGETVMSDPVHHPPHYTQGDARCSQITEVWRTYPKDERYEVSTFGRVRRADTGRIRAPSVSKNGYLVCVFSRPGQKPSGHYVHRMVMETFVRDARQGEWVSHLDGSRSNNCIGNLCYESRSANMRRKIQHGTHNDCERNGQAKLDERRVVQILERASTGEPARDIASAFGVSTSQIVRICRGDNWSAVHKNFHRGSPV